MTGQKRLVTCSSDKNLVCSTPCTTIMCVYDYDMICIDCFPLHLVIFDSSGFVTGSRFTWGSICGKRGKMKIRACWCFLVCLSDFSLSSCHNKQKCWGRLQLGTPSTFPVLFLFRWVITDNDTDAIRKYKCKIRELEYDLETQTTRAAAKHYFTMNLRTENNGVKVCIESMHGIAIRYCYVIDPRGIHLLVRSTTCMLCVIEHRMNFAP